MIASRSSQVTSLKGSTPSVVNRRSIVKPPSATLAVGVDIGLGNCLLHLLFCLRTLLEVVTRDGCDRVGRNKSERALSRRFGSP